LFFLLTGRHYQEAGFTLKFSLKGVKRVHPEGFSLKGC